MTNTGEQEIIHNIFNLSVAGFGRRGESRDGPCTRPMLGGPSAPQTLLIFKDHYPAPSGWSSLQHSHQLPFVIQLQSKNFPSGNRHQKASLFPVAKQLQGKKKKSICAEAAQHHPKLSIQMATCGFSSQMPSVHHAEAKLVGNREEDSNRRRITFIRKSQP